MFAENLIFTVTDITLNAAFIHHLVIVTPVSNGSWCNFHKICD